MSFADLTGLVLDACNAALGEAVEYRPAAGSPRTVRGIFNERYTELAGTGLSVQSAQPNLLVKIADLAAAPRLNDRVLVRTVEYKVIRSEPDGEGASLLFLQKTA
jgi:hypothetical protein